ncbi:endo alpha-1,4 polygalactosaminidase [Paraburkholderia heleia]|uniref:endo alpha-1,4 polygalactosaminidase n=1 Tax=Paraburkholderia heleia TaxID=634127 RepID=UPI002AB73DD0|nr:endo alpha-1,4 polygalactosaminidase [Paraburkholderia heleia]
MTAHPNSVLRTHTAALVSAVLLAGCGGGGTASQPASPPATSGTGNTTTPSAVPINGSTSVTIAGSRNLDAHGAWVVYYGAASQADLARMAQTFRLIVVDADPANGSPAITPSQIATLRSDGAKVLSYLNFGACETWRTYWNNAPPGFMACSTNTAAQLGKMAGYPEYWMNPANSDYQHLIADYVAPQLMATGVDGLMLDNFELVGHGSSASDGPCDTACAQGGLNLVARLRNAFPGAPIVLNHAPVAALSGTSGGIAFPMLVDGDFGEQVFAPTQDSAQVQELQTWRSMEATLPRSAFFTGTLDYLSDCAQTGAAQNDWNASLSAGLNPSVATAALNQICWWPFLPS